MRLAIRITLWLLASACVSAALSVLPGCGSAPKAAAAAPAGSRSYAFWPQFPDEPRVQFIRSFGSSEDVAPTKSGGIDQLVFGKESASATGIQKPYGVAMRDGKIYVCDIRSGGVTVLDLKKKQTRLVGVTGLNRLNHPVDIAVADDGTLYVADNDRGAILVFDASERYMSAFGHDKFKPVSVAVHDTRLYVCNMAAQVVEVLDRRDGRPLGTIGSVGDEDGQFRLPLGVDTDEHGDVYVVDMMRCKVQKFSPDGKFISAIGTLGDYAGSFARPKQIAIDRDGIAYVVDAAFQNVQMFDPQGRLLMAFGSAGGYPGAMDLPAGVCVSDEGVDLFAGDIHPGFEAKRLIIVTNQFGPAKVSVYAMGRCRAGYTAQDLAAAAAPVSAGVGAPSARRLRMQTTGNEEPAPEAGEGDQGGEQGADRPAGAPPEKPAAKPAPKSPEKPSEKPPTKPGGERR